MEAVGYLGDAHRRGAKQERGFHQEHLVDVVDDSTPRDLTDDARKFVPQLRKENLGGWNVILTDDEFQRLDDTLNRLPVHGYRGFEEYEGGTMADWGKRKLG